MKASTFAVVVNWNGGDHNLECLESLRAAGLPESHVIFVDNASSDGSPEEVARRFPDVRLVRHETNLGFGHGVNRGIEEARAAGARRVLLVNNDAVLDEGALERLGAALDDDPRLGIVGPRIVFKDRPERIWAAGGRITYRQNLSLLIGHREPDGPSFQGTFEVDYVTGCVMLIRDEVFERAGLFEADYFAYHEDVEFCMKAREAGFGLQTIGAARARHAAHGTTGGGYNARRKYMMGVNTVWFLRKHGTPGRWLSFLVYDVLSLPLVWLLHAPRGEGAAVVAKARGMFDGLLGRKVTAERLGLR